MDILSAEQENIDFMLTQMGANVKSLHGLICNASFHINGTEILYVYNLNEKDQYYLQKILPYPIGVGEFKRPSEIVDYIEKDIECYKNASKSSVFKDFININKELNNTIQKMDDAFLMYNVPHDKLDEIFNEIEKINQTISEIKKVSSTVK